MKKVIFLIIASLLVIGLVLPGCAGEGPGTPTLKIGVLQSLDWIIGVDGYHGMVVGANQWNDAGGVEIGGTTYEIELILYDHHLDILNANTGAESLIEDGCDYILGDCFCTPAINTTEAEGVVMIASMYDAANLYPDFEYQWSGAGGSTTYAAAVPLLAGFTNTWGSENRTYQGVFPDRFDGWLSAAQHESAAASANLTVLESIFYDATTTERSTEGALIYAADPDILDAYGGGPDLDAGVIAAAVDAGWTGEIFLCSTAPAFLVQIFAGAAAEGAIGIGWPVEFGTTTMATEFIADWTTEYGEWTFPEIVVAQELWVLITAMQEAGSIDPEDIKAVLDSGMTFESPCGPGQMIARPDLGNTRTVDNINWDLPIKQIVGGNITVVGVATESMMKDVVDAMY